MNIVIGWEMWTGQQLGCYWTWKMQGDWLRPSQRSEPVTTTDYEKPTQDAGRGRHSLWPGGGGVTSNNRGEITWQEMILWDDLRHLHQCHNTNVETMWVLRLLWCNSDLLIWHKCLPGLVQMKYEILLSFKRVFWTGPVFSCEENPYLGPGVLGNGPHEAYWWCWLWRRQNQHNKIFHGTWASL